MLEGHLVAVVRYGRGFLRRIRLQNHILGSIVHHRRTNGNGVVRGAVPRKGDASRTVKIVVEPCRLIHTAR